MTHAVTTIHPHYSTFFPQNGQKPDNFEAFNSSKEALGSGARELPVDFSEHDKTWLERGWKDCAKSVALVGLKVLFFPWGAYDLSKYCLQRLVMLPLFPAQSRIVKFVLGSCFGMSSFKEHALKEIRKSFFSKPEPNIPCRAIYRHVVLEKNGVRYSGLLLGTKETINNGQWIMQATGNGGNIECSAKEFFEEYHSRGYNALLINGPCVGSSEGHATPESMGEAQALGLSFLESAIKARKIAIAGRSLGGAAIGQAILQHTFKQDGSVKYLVIRQMTFDRASTVCSEKINKLCPIFKNLVNRIVKWSGCEMDSIAASKKLQDLRIKEVIIQAGRSHERAENRTQTLEDFHEEENDVIPVSASLGYGLVKEGITEHKIFRGIPHATHKTLRAIQITGEELALDEELDGLS